MQEHSLWQRHSRLRLQQIMITIMGITTGITTIMMIMTITMVGMMMIGMTTVQDGPGMEIGMVVHAMASTTLLITDTRIRTSAMHLHMAGIRVLMAIRTPSSNEPVRRGARYTLKAVANPDGLARRRTREKPGLIPGRASFMRSATREQNSISSVVGT